MAALPTLDEAEIRAQVGARNLTEGRRYAERRLTRTQRKGDTLLADCQGSRPVPYHVEVTLAADGIEDAECSCPVGGGGQCKHVAAVLLAWREAPEEFVEARDLDALLEKRSKAELIALVKQLLRREPGLEDLLDLPLPVAGRRSRQVNPEVYRRRVDAAFSLDEHKWGASLAAAEALLPIREMGEQFLEQGDRGGAAAVFIALAQGFMENHERFPYDDGELSSLFDAALNGLDGCLEAEPEDDGLRATIFATLVEIYILGGEYVYGDQAAEVVVARSTAAERPALAARLRQRISEEWKRDAGEDEETGNTFLLRLEGDAMDDETFLNACRAAGLLDDAVERLLARGRIEEAAKEAGASSAYDCLGLMERFVRHGHAGVAEQLARERLKRRDDPRLLQWLQERVAARGDTPAALELSERLFRAGPTLDRFQQTRALAMELGRWEALRPQLLAVPDREREASVLAQIYLDEGEIDRALEAVRAGRGQDWSLRQVELQVARAAEATHPREAIRIYLDRAEQWIEHRGRASYQEAAEELQRARALYEQLGDLATWTRTIEGVRARHKHLWALKQELAAAGL